MKTLHALVITLAVSTVSLACSGTARDASPRGSSRAAVRGTEPARVTGTVVDAASGERLSGVKIGGPHDTRCVSGRDGRFELTGLFAGDVGEIVAETSDGRSARLPLRRLSPGALEVVLQLARP